ncbi:MAG: hypothetical protein WCA20_36505, partial [Candidatus Sulfotelmatobacter sp.]
LIDSMRECAFDEALGADDISDCNDYLFHVREWGGEQNSLIRSPSPGLLAFLQRIGCCIAISNLLPLFEPSVLWRIWMCFAEEHERTSRLDYLIETAQGLGAVHPVEGAPHDNELETAKLQTKFVGASLTFGVNPCAAATAAATISGAGSSPMTSPAK